MRSDGGKLTHMCKTLQEKRWQSYICKVGFPVDCLFLNIQMYTDITLSQKTEHVADQVGKMWTSIREVQVQIPVRISTTMVCFSLSRRVPRQYLELGPVASFQIRGLEF